MMMIMRIITLVDVSLLDLEHTRIVALGSVLEKKLPRVITILRAIPLQNEILQTSRIRRSESIAAHLISSRDAKR